MNIDLLKLLKSAKEAELEVINQLIEENTDKSGSQAAKEDTPKGKKESSKVKASKEKEEDDSESYDDMTAAELYKLCCSRGLSGKCKSRKKSSLIEVLKEADNQSDDSDEEDWGDDEEEDEGLDYDNMTAKELYTECVKRGIKTKARLKPSDYIKLLKADDEGDDTDQDDDEEDWEI